MGNAFPFRIPTIAAEATGEFIILNPGLTGGRPTIGLAAGSQGGAKTLPELESKIPTAMGVYTNTLGKAAIMEADASYGVTVIVDPKLDDRGGKRRRA